MSEFTIPSDSQYDKDCHLSIDNISIDSRDNPQLIKVTLKQSKTDLFRRGVDLYLGAKGAITYPVKGLLPYLALRGHHKGPLFILEDGKYLIYQHPNSLLDKLQTKLQIDNTKYDTHSFCIGVATNTRQANIPDALIELMRRWKSNAYLTYVKTPPTKLVRLSKYVLRH